MQDAQKSSANLEKNVSCSFEPRKTAGGASSLKTLWVSNTGSSTLPVYLLSEIFFVGRNSVFNIILQKLEHEFYNFNRPSCYVYLKKMSPFDKRTHHLKLYII